MVKKMTILEASEYFNISKEAIYNRIRRGSLESVLEDGVKLVIVDKNSKTKNISSKVTLKNQDKHYQFLEEQNEKLQKKIELLESETKHLREQKELILINQMQKIEEIYKEKDKQLKNLLTTISSQFISNLNSNEKIKEEETLEVEIEETPMIESKKISLKKYLKEQNLSKKKISKIFKKFKKLPKDDKRIIKIGNKYYIDTLKYDYSDLI